MLAKARNIISPEARVTGGGELPLTTVLLEEQQVIITAELSVQPLRLETLNLDLLAMLETVGLRGLLEMC